MPSDLATAINDQVLLYYILHLSPELSFKKFVDRAYIKNTDKLAFGRKATKVRRENQYRVRDLKNRLRANPQDPELLLPEGFELEVRPSLIVMCSTLIHLTFIVVCLQRYITMSSSSEDETEVSSVSTKTTKIPTKVGGRKKKPDPVPAKKSRSLTPTKQELRHQQYREEEDLISDAFKMDVEEGWSNPVAEIGRADIKDKRSDDGKRTYKGVNLTILTANRSTMDNTTIRLATERGNKVSNRIILELPKQEEATSKMKKALIKSCEEHHGKCESRDEGIRRSFSKVLKGDKRRYELTMKGVGDLTNREWQGDKYKQDPCYLKVSKDVLGTKASTAIFRMSVEIACVDGVEDVSSDESGSSREGKKTVDRKLRGMGYDDGTSSSSSSESEESEGELIHLSIIWSTHHSHCQSTIHRHR